MALKKKATQEAPFPASGQRVTGGLGFRVEGLGFRFWGLGFRGDSHIMLVRKSWRFLEIGVTLMIRDALQGLEISKPILARPWPLKGN